MTSRQSRSQRIILITYRKICAWRWFQEVHQPGIQKVYCFEYPRTRLLVVTQISILCASCRKLGQDNSNAAVGCQLGVEAGALARGKFGHAAIIAVVHVVIYEDLDNGFEWKKFRVTYGWDPRHRRRRYRGQWGIQKQGKPREGYHRRGLRPQCNHPGTCGKARPSVRLRELGSVRHYS